MKKLLYRICSGLMAASMILSVTNTSLINPSAIVLAEEVVMVANYDEFAGELQKGSKNILITDSFTIRDANLTETSGVNKGQMKPIEIPGGTVISGEGATTVTSSHPIQIMGDGVVIRDIEFVFNSTDSMNSIPHREIYLAGHSLTLDNVSTYLEGGNSVAGSLTGTEKELLPTVYGGKYNNDTGMGNCATLNVTNSNKKTMFQDIYLGHDSLDNVRSGYYGKASLELDAATVVRGGIYSTPNKNTEISFVGKENEEDEIKLKHLYGNQSTTLSIDECTVSGAVINGIENILVKDGGRLEPAAETTKLGRITLVNGGCLDLSKMKDVDMSGNLTGDIEVRKGILVLNRQGSLRINGGVSGVTQLQVGSHIVPGTLLNGHTYVTATGGNADNFVLSQRDISNNYRLDYSEGSWTTNLNTYVDAESEPFGATVVKSWSQTDIKDIPADIKYITEESPYLEIKWTDMYDENIPAAKAMESGYYKNVILMRSDYWEKEDCNDKTDWRNNIVLKNDGIHPDRYYLISTDDVTEGRYSILVCAEDVSGLVTVADVKELKESYGILNNEGILEVEFVDRPEINKPQEQPHRHTAKTQIVQAKPGKNGSITSICKTCKKTLSKKIIHAPKTVALSRESYVYDGKNKTPEIKVFDNKGNVIAIGSYSVSYRNNKNVGNASVTVKFKGNYTGSMTRKFKINPQGTVIANIRTTRTSITMKWKKQTLQTSGYEISYSTEASFSKKNTKTILIKSNHTVMRAVRGLKAGRRYYIRIRTFKNIKVGNKLIRLNSAWSKRVSKILR